jgi:hypothetical protein
MGWPNNENGDQTREPSSSSGAKPSAASTTTLSPASDDESAASGSGELRWDLSPESESNADAVTLSVHPTTGGQFTVQVTITDSVDTLKKVVSHKLKVPKERICLLYRDRCVNWSCSCVLIEKKS